MLQRDRLLPAILAVMWLMYDDDGPQTPFDPSDPEPTSPGPTVPEPTPPDIPDPYPVSDPVPSEPTPQPVSDPQPGGPGEIPPRIF